MSQSNNTQEFDNILFQVNRDESDRSDSLASQSNNLFCNTAESLDFNYNLSTANDLMSLEDFLDLVPANSYFH